MTHNPWHNSDFTPPAKTRWWSSRMMLILLLAIVVFVGLIIFWNMIISHTDDVEEGNIPVIAAETLTIKERPQAPVIEEGDSVYGLISKEKSKSTSLKTDVEEPVYESSFQTETESMEAPTQVRNPKAEVIAINQPSLPVPSSVAPLKIKPEKMGTFSVQVGSFPSKDEALKETQRLKRKHKTLAPHTIKVVPKDIEGKGTYYRLYAGDFSNKEEASKFCKELTQQGTACMIAG